MRRLNFRIAPLIVAGLLTLAAGCGYKDDLYLPKPDDKAQKPADKTSASAPAGPEQPATNQ